MADEERARVRLSAQNGAVRALMASETVEEAVPAVLGAICRTLGWTLGQLWQPDPTGEVLRLAYTWSDPAADVQSFIEAGRKATLPGGTGLPGRVWEIRQAVWITDLLEDANFPRREAARPAGLHGGFGVPVPLGDGAVGVMEFFTREVIEPDDELLATMESLGAQVGQFIERRRAEAALRESEERFRTFASSVPDATFVIDEESQIIYVNEAVRKIFGYEPSEVIGQPLTQLMPEEYRAGHEAGIARYIESGERRIPWDGIELPGLRKDGSRVPLEITYGAYTKDGRHFFTGIARDITERKRANDRVRFQADLLNAVGEAVIATDLDGRILYWNAFAERLYGWPAEEVIGRDIAEITPAEISRESAREVLDRLKQGENWTGEFLVRNRDGREFPVLVVDSPIQAEDGKLIGIIGVSAEITERKRREVAQRFLAEASRALGESLDLETTVGTLARMAVPALGDWSLVQTFGGQGRATQMRVVQAQEEEREAAEQLCRLLIDDSQELVGRAVEGEGPVHLTAAQLAADPTGERITELGVSALLLAPLRARDTVLGMLVTARTGDGADYRDEDVELVGKLANRAALAADNALLYREAQEANRAKADFLAVVSHELRTPLNAITGYADLMASGVSGELTEKQTTHIERIKVGARHLAQLIDEILAYARVETGRETINAGSVELGHVVREAVVVIQPLAEDKQLDLRVEVPESGLRCTTDAAKFRQIVVNLLSNAVKYTQEGEVVVTLEDHEGGARLVVRDTGLGIEKENLERIFEPFWQAEPPNTRSAGGTGLGLSVNRRLVSMLGGSIRVESEPGRGSTFTVLLPASPPPGSP